MGWWGCLKTFEGEVKKTNGEVKVVWYNFGCSL
jgi:hypothetical protein